MSWYGYVSEKVLGSVEDRVREAAAFALRQALRDVRIVVNAPPAVQAQSDAEMAELAALLRSLLR